MTETKTLLNALQKWFPQLDDLELLGLMSKHGSLRHFRAGEVLMEAGQPIPFLPFLLEGTIQILRPKPDGRELFLYFLQAGETCAMSLGCCQPTALSQVKAIAEEDGSLMGLPLRFVEPFTDEFSSFRRFVITTLQTRFESLLSVVDALAFHHLDDRLISYLQSLSTARNQRTLRVTHQAIADHLATTREVVSRLLKQLELLGRIRLGRNQLEWLG